MNGWIIAILAIIAIVLFIVGAMNLKTTWGMILLFLGLLLMGTNAIIALSGLFGKSSQ